MKYAIEDVHADVLSEAINAAGYQVTGVNGDTVRVKVDNLIILVKPKPNQKVVSMVAVFGTKADRAAVMAFCNKFNDSLVMVRASVGAEVDRDGDFVLLFDHDFPFADGQKVDVARMVSHLDRFSKIVAQGMMTCGGSALF